MGVPLVAAFGRLLGHLDRLSTLPEFRDHPWFERLASAEVIGRAHYVLGEDEAALAWIQRRAEARAEERGGTVEEWVDRIIELTGMGRLVRAP